MAQVRVGGDPESYMDPPVLTSNDKDKIPGKNVINGILDLLSIHRNVARGPKAPKESSDKPAISEAPKPAGIDSPGDYLDHAGAAALAQDTINYKPVGIIDPNDFLTPPAKKKPK